MPEIQLGLEDLRRRILRTADRLSGAPIILSSDIVSLSVTIKGPPLSATISRKDIANVLSALTSDMKRYGPEEIRGATIDIEVHKSGAYVPAAEINITFEQL